QLPAGWPVDQPQLPEQFAAVQPEAVERASADQILSRLAARAGAPQEIAQRAEGATLVARPLDRLGPAGPDALDVAEADAHRLALDRAVPPAGVDVRTPEADPVPPGVADDDLGRVEAHRLGVEQRAGELDWIVKLQPGALVSQQRE